MDIVTQEQQQRRIIQLGLNKEWDRDYTYAMDDDPFSYPKKEMRDGGEIIYSNEEDNGIYL